MDFHLNQFPPDACELRYHQISEAQALLRERRPDLPVVMSQVGASFIRHFGERFKPVLQKTQDALALSFVRMATRHGTWGTDAHDYHNEEHALEVLNGRLARVRLSWGWQGLEAQEWILLALFATCHDLRQREAPTFENNIGANERASIAEAHRILAAAGFDAQVDQEYFESLAWMIAGSTFDARPVPPLPLNSADAVNSGGSLSSALLVEFEQRYPHFATTPELSRRARLILYSADLDTANVGEPFLTFVNSSLRLVREREMRAGRSLDAGESAAEVFEFLTHGQERYFYKLHRFVSKLGREVFGQGKTINSPKLKKLTDAMREEFSATQLAHSTGAAVIARFMAYAKQLG
jgi:hypothetical protein